MLSNLSHLPNPAKRHIALHLKPAAERAVRQGHPWVYEASIRKQSREGGPGDLAIIFDQRNRYLAVGLYDPTSPIRVKVLQANQQARIDAAFLRARLQASVDHRQPYLDPATTDGYRVVHGENDGLPGLIIDRYADVLVIKVYTQAWFAWLQPLLEVLPDVIDASVWVLRLARNVQVGETFGLRDGLLLRGTLPDDGDVEFRENGLRFRANVLHGHKTGFFFDQRENRAHVRDLAQDRRVLDLFSYNGGFSVYAAAGGASNVLSVDVSVPALDEARRNMALNAHHAGVQQVEHRIQAADVFEVLDALAQENEVFDLVVVDPPSFASSSEQEAGALVAYATLTEQALRVLATDGILVSASCSSRVSRETFFETVEGTARRVGRPLQVFERTTHAVDHPLRSSFPEGAYLKCLYARA